MKTLHLTLKKKWFDMILSGEKKEEYREIKPYWQSRINGRTFDAIRFRNGYSSDSPAFTIECLGISIGHGRSEWGAPIGENVYCLKLGNIISAT